MAYRFKKNESLPHAIRRVFVEEIAWAVGQLAAGKNRIEAVHEARKSIKKIRALLSLAASRLGPLHKSEDAYFQRAGRRLSHLRDSAVVLEAFDSAAHKHGEIVDLAVLTEFRRNLQRSQRETPPEKQVSLEVARLLNEARTKANCWPLEGIEYEALLPDLKAAYRRGRKALQRAQKVDSTEALHDFRKTVKQHWYHLRLLEGLWDEATKERAGHLRELETWLGDANNLSVLRERLAADVETRRDRQQIRHFMALLDEDAKELRERALAAGQRLYAGKPQVFGEQVAKLWAAAQAPRKRPGNVTLKTKSAVA